MTVALFINEPPLQTLPALVSIVGIAEAVVLQELHYQLRTAPLEHGRPWLADLAMTCANRYPFWDEQFIKHVIMGLESNGILLVEDGSPPHHTIDYDHLQSMANIPINVTRHHMQDVYTSVGVNTNRDFLFNIRVSKTAQNCHTMLATTPSHLLVCELKLEVTQNRQQAQVICHFPRINSKKIFKACKGAHIIYDIIMILFQAGVLDQLFVFCAKHGASSLVIVPDANSNLSLYWEFLREPILDKAEAPTTMIIPVAHETRQKFAHFMQEAISKFRGDLRDQQKTNVTVTKLADRLLPGFLDG